jgi:hypothetical protein
VGEDSIGLIPLSVHEVIDAALQALPQRAEEDGDEGRSGE